MSQIQVLAWKCDRLACGHEWTAKTKPLACAKCKSRNWDAGVSSDAPVVTSSHGAPPGITAHPFRIAEAPKKTKAGFCPGCGCHRDSHGFSSAMGCTVSGCKCDKSQGDIK